MDESDQRCSACGAEWEYTPGCEECDESRAALYALTGDARYKFPHEFVKFEEGRR